MLFSIFHKSKLVFQVLLVIIAGLIIYNLVVVVANYRQHSETMDYLTAVAILASMIDEIELEANLTARNPLEQDQLRRQRMVTDKKIAKGLENLGETSAGEAVLLQFEDLLTTYLSANRTFFDQHGNLKKSKQFYQGIILNFNLLLNARCDETRVYELQAASGSFQAANQDIRPLPIAGLLSRVTMASDRSRMQIFILSLALLLFACLGLAATRIRSSLRSERPEPDWRRLQQENYSLQAQYKNSQEQLQNQKQNLEKISADRQKLKNSFQELTRESTQANDGLGVLKRAYRELQNEKESMQQENKRLKMEHSQTKRRVKELEDHGRELSLKSQMLQGRLADAETTASHHQHSAQQGWKENLILGQRLKLREDEILELRQRQSKLESRLGQLNFRLHQVASGKKCS